jgi:acyl-homoserine-lactone acylase
VAAASVGESFDAWLVPAMRLVVDFSEAEPLQAANSTGQSGHPSSAHYDDGVFAWLAGRYQTLPFGAEAIGRQYRPAARLVPRAKGR